MLNIAEIKIEGLREGCITDTPPQISFSLESSVTGESLERAWITVGTWVKETTDQINNRYDGELLPFTSYPVHIKVLGTSGAMAEAAASFQTGRLDTKWHGRWITDGSYDFPKKVSPKPMTFRKAFAITKFVTRAWIHATALGVYELELNGSKVGEDYFAPGFTSYAHHIQYQTYDVTAALQTQNRLQAVVAGGWAAGSFNYIRKNKISADRQAFLCELHVEYTDGSTEIISSDESWEVAMDGHYVMAEWYDGETYDATIDLEKASWKPASITSPRKQPKLLAQYGAPVRAQERLQPVGYHIAASCEIIYDFGQNFAGVIDASLHAKHGQRIVFRHAEVLVDGELFVKSLRTAKATAQYISREGYQHYSPRLTYMGFRYVGVTGIAPEDLQLSAIVLHSQIEEIGSFACSNPLINQLQSNIRWGGKSNFVDIPTDCPQRDERQGWTGDIAVFARTASYNFDMSRFFDKWLRDVRAEQGWGGGIPMVVPRGGDSWPVMATSAWGDSCVLVPWAEYLARGNKQVLIDQYDTIKRFLRAAKRWSSLFAMTKHQRHIWQFPFHFGDWCAPNETVKQWMKKGKWVATAYYANSCGIAAQIAELLGYEEDAQAYKELRRSIIKAYRSVFTDGEGKLKKEFQTAYVLPLYFAMTEGDETQRMAEHLVRLVREADNHLTTGFTGTPYLLFALSDHGYADVAYDVLLQEGCPSWLYEVKAGGTTIWERWDALRPDGTVNIGDLTGKQSEADSNGGMVSFNHYANGAVGDWLYRRMVGLEPLTGGYQSFKVKPIIGGGITWAKGSVKTPYGTISVSWMLEDHQFTLELEVPVSTTCSVELPNGEFYELGSGRHVRMCVLAD